MPSSVQARVAVLSALVAVVTGSADGTLARQSRQPDARPAGPTVDFVALRTDGTPVADLQASEVEIRINGRLRALRALRRVATAPAPVAPGTAAVIPAPFGTNDTVAAGRSIALVVDQESFVTGREQLLRDAVEGLLSELTPADQVTVLVLPFGGMKVPLTSDLTRVRIAMAGLAGQGNRNETGSDLACRTRRFLEALDGFLQGQAGRASPLTVVLFTAGLAGPRRDAPMALAPGMCELLVDHFKHVTETAGAARANVFVVQPDDLAMAGGRLRETIAGSGFLGSDNPLEGIEHLAGATGGVRLPLDAMGTRALARVARESAAYYEAELEPERVEVLGRSRTLAVRVSRAGVTVRARPEITFGEGPRAAAARLSLNDLLASRDSQTDLPLRVAGFSVRDAQGRLRVGVVVEPVDATASLASVGAVLKNSSGGVMARWFAADSTERPLLGAMLAPPGTCRLRVAAIDSAGRFGAAEEVMEAGLISVGPISLGSLMLGIARDEGVSPRLQFGAEAVAVASFDLYGGTAGTQVAAALEVARGLDAPAIASLPLRLTRAGESRVTAMGAIPIGALPAGDYVVRGVIRLEDGTTGRVVRTLRKVAR